jgi:putrescine aminotransferase
MSIAKGMSSGYQPIGGVMIGDRIAEVLIGKGGEFHHGFTYSGHPVACAVSCATINILRREAIVERVRDDVGPYLQRRWAELATHQLVGETRIVGMIGALELVKDKAKRQLFANPGDVGTLCRDICIEQGLVMRAVRDTMIVAPPLVMKHSEVDELMERARKALDIALDKVHKQGLL